MHLTVNPPKALDSFWACLPQDAQRDVSTLSAAVALTDDLAEFLLKQAGSGKFSPGRFIDALRGCDFVSVRNGEWRMEQSTRQYLLSLSETNQEHTREIHRQILKVINNGDNGFKLPSYLKKTIGRAYHTTFLNPEAGLDLYQKAFFQSVPGEDWLAGRLAAEQQEGGWLPKDALEPDYYQGMAARRELDFPKAEKHLLRVCQRPDVRIEVAISLHLLGLDLWHRHHQPKEAETYLRRSLKIGEDLGDLPHQAQVLHSLANLIARREPEEAENYLRRSLKIEKDLGDSHGEAQVLHSLANLIARRQPEEAENYLRLSLKIGEDLGDLSHQAPVLHSLANLIARSQPKEAETYLRRSLKIGDLYHEAQVLHSLANLIARRQPKETETYLRRSLKIREDVGDSHDLGQVLNSLGYLYRNWGPTYWDQALSCFQEAIDRSEDARDQAIALDGLSQIWERKGDKNMAIAYLERAIEFQKSTDYHRPISSMIARLERLKAS